MSRLCLLFPANKQELTLFLEEPAKPVFGGPFHPGLKLVLREVPVLAADCLLRILVEITE